MKPEFANPWFLLGFIPLVAWFVVELWRERGRVAPLPYPGLPGRKLPISLRARLRRVPTVLRFLTLALIVVALSGPRVPSDELPVHKEGVDIVVAFDISTSMKALDFEPSDRFGVARDTIADFVRGRPDDRLGLVIFAGQAFTQCPLTHDHGVLLNILQTIRMDVIEDGTAIGDALGVAVNRLRDSEAKSKIVVLLTDGANNKGSLDPEEAARAASELGIRIHTIQVGKGGRVPYPARNFDFFRQAWVNTVQTAEVPVNPELLKTIAETTKGHYFMASDSETLRQIFTTIDKMEKTELPGAEFVMYEEVYQPFVLAALALLFLELLLSQFWLRRFP